MTKTELRNLMIENQDCPDDYTRDGVLMVVGNSVLTASHTKENVITHAMLLQEWLEQPYESCTRRYAYTLLEREELKGAYGHIVGDYLVFERIMHTNSSKGYVYNKRDLKKVLKANIEYLRNKGIKKVAMVSYSGRNAIKPIIRISRLMEV